MTSLDPPMVLVCFAKTSQNSAATEAAINNFGIYYGNQNRGKVRPIT